MTLHINNPEADRLARELADKTGETVEQAVINSLRDKLAAHAHKKEEAERLVAEIMEIGRRCAALPVLDPRSPDEILGYDENGLPT